MQQEGQITPNKCYYIHFPGFPTDMQAQWTAYMCFADGVSTVTDTIYISIDLNTFPN